MKKNLTLICIALLAISVVSCKKDSAVASSDITGNWKFVSIHAKTLTSSQSVVGTDIYKSVSTSDYTTINNTGTFVIDASNFNGTGVSYGVNSTATATLYQNGAVLSTTTNPLVTSVAAFNSTAAYTKVGNDSLYFPSGSAFSGGVTGGGSPSGLKYVMQDDKMILTQSIATSTTNPGTGDVTQISATTVATLQR